MKYAIIAAAILLTGCSSFKMGGACYIPYGVTGSCTVDTASQAKDEAAKVAPVK